MPLVAESRQPLDKPLGAAAQVARLRLEVLRQLIDDIELSKLDALEPNEQRAELRNAITEIMLSTDLPLNRIERERLVQELPYFAPALRLMLLPDWQTLPYDQISPHQDLVSDRLATLYQMTQRAFDVVAMPPETPLIRAGRAHGHTVITGAEVIALQAALQFTLYTGVTPTPEQVRRASEFSRS